MPAALGVALLVAALTLGRARQVGLSLALLGLGYVLATIGRPVDAGAVLYGTGLLAVAELAFWSLDLRGAADPPLGAHRRRWLFITATCAASTVLGGAVLLAGAVAPGGAAREVAAALAAAGVVGLLVALSRGATAATHDGPSPSAPTPPP